MSIMVTGPAALNVGRVHLELTKLETWKWPKSSL